MANANMARGLIPVRHRNGSPYTGAARRYYIPATDNTALFIGDPVKFVTDASDANGVQTITKASAGDYLLGVVVGVITDGNPPVVRTRDSGVSRAASTEAYILVADDPDIIFEAQEDGVGGVMTVGAVGRNVEWINGTGSATTGFSGVLLDSNTLQTTNTLSLRIVEAVDRPDNDPTASYAKWLVMINLHAMRNLSGV